MAKERKIAPVEQYIIDQVRIIRRELDITAEELSRRVSPSGDKSLIGGIESIVTSGTYTDHNLNLIAAIFTEKATALPDTEIQKEYTVYDFYPEQPLDDAPLQKTVTDLKRKIGPAKCLKTLTEAGYLDDSRTLKEITTMVNELLEDVIPQTSMTSPINYAVMKGELIRIDLQDGTVLYQKAPSKQTDEKSVSTDTGVQ